MINLPPSTIFNKRVPKERFYLGRKNVVELKTLFTNAVDRIIWVNKLSAQSLNMPPSTEIQEIEIFHTTLTTRTVDERLYITMDDAVNPHIVLHVFETSDHAEVVLGYRHEKKMHHYSHYWGNINDIDLNFTAPTLDAIYLSLLRQLSRNSFVLYDGATVTETIEKNARRLDLETQIEKLKRRRKNEKQINRQFEISNQIRILQDQLRKLLSHGGTETRRNRDTE